MSNSLWLQPRSQPNLESQGRQGKTTKRKRKAKQKPSLRKKTWNVIKKPVLKLSALLVFIFVCYLGYLDYTVREQFEGKRWAIPARVYASPVELYAGSKINAQQLISLLKKLHYRADSTLSSQATYKKSALDGELKNPPILCSGIKLNKFNYMRIAFSDLPKSDLLRI